MPNLKLKNRKGNSAVEYAFLIAVVIGALLGMQAYLKRPICQRWRLAGDAFGFGRQYQYAMAVEPPEELPDPITLVQLQIFEFDFDRNMVLLPGIPEGGFSSVTLTGEQVATYYYAILEHGWDDWDDPFEITEEEFHTFFGPELGPLEVRVGEDYWMSWRDEQAPTIVIEAMISIIGG